MAKSKADYSQIAGDALLVNQANTSTAENGVLDEAAKKAARDALPEYQRRRNNKTVKVRKGLRIKSEQERAERGITDVAEPTSTIQMSFQITKDLKKELDIYVKKLENKAGRIDPVTGKKSKRLNVKSRIIREGLALYFNKVKYLEKVEREIAEGKRERKPRKRASKGDKK